MNQVGGEIQPGARKHPSEASIPGAQGASSMPAWYPELLASVSLRVTAGRSKAVSAANQELLISYRERNKLPCQFIF